MNTIAPTRPTETQVCRVRLPAGPAAAAEARSRVRAAICDWDVPVDPDIAALLASELVTNAIRHEAGETITLAISFSFGQLRVDVHDTSRYLPVRMDAPADAETGRGLMLVATLSAGWGAYCTPAGKAVYFTLASHPDLPGTADAHTRGDCEPFPGPLTVPTKTLRRFPRPTGFRGVVPGPAGHRDAMVRKADSRAMSIRE